MLSLLRKEKPEPTVAGAIGSTAISDEVLLAVVVVALAVAPIKKEKADDDVDAGATGGVLLSLLSSGFVFLALPPFKSRPPNILSLLLVLLLLLLLLIRTDGRWLGLQRE